MCCINYDDFTYFLRNIYTLLDESLYTAASWAALAVALENAQNVADNDEARQSEVNAARGALQAAMNALKLLSNVVDVID